MGTDSLGHDRVSKTQARSGVPVETGTSWSTQGIVTNKV